MYNVSLGQMDMTRRLYGLQGIRLSKPQEEELFRQIAMNVINQFSDRIPGQVVPAEVVASEDGTS